MHSVSVFIPIYNEEKSIEENVKKVYDKLKGIKAKFELFIVDDGSIDNTPKIGKRLSKEYQGIVYLRFDNGPSRRENLASSFKYAKFDTVVYMDSDIATDLAYLPTLMDNLKYYDIILGNRYLYGSRATRKSYRLIISKAYNIFIRLYFGSKITDHGCGFKAFRKSVILDLVRDAGGVGGLKRGWFWDAEILIRAQRKKYSILQLPIEWRFGKESKFKLVEEMKMLPYILTFHKRLKKNHG